MSPSWGYLAYLDLDPELKHPIEWSEDQRTERESNKMSTNHLGAMPLPNSNEQFSAWSEYLGEEKDVDFIEWKKDMVGEGRKRDKPSRVTEKPTATKQRRAKRLSKF